MEGASDSIAGRFSAGDAEAYAAVSRWIAQTLTQPRFHLLRGEWKDLHQETVRRVLESLSQGRYDATRDFRVYVQAVARYAARDTLVAKLRQLGWREIEDTDAQVEAEELELVLIRDAARRVMAQVEAPCRALFQLFFFEQRSQESIAAELGVAVGTVKSRLFRCLRRAREQCGNSAQVERQRARSDG